MGAKGMEPMDVPYWGLDLCPENRPGVPREAPPHPLPGAHWIEPAWQPTCGPLLTRPTPVFSTALPPKGVSGTLRRIAHGIPDHRTRHWVLLFLADRIDAVENLPSLFKRRAARPAGRRGTAAQRR
jgi:hypothetical protein